MARFYVGQRVRVLWKRTGPSPPGVEGRVVEIGYWPAGTLAKNGAAYQYGGQCFVDIGTENLGLFLFDQLEPIQDPGRQVISWEEMADLWTPEKVGA